MCSRQNVEEEKKTTQYTTFWWHQIIIMFAARKLSLEEKPYTGNHHLGGAKWGKIIYVTSYTSAGVEVQAPV